MHISYVNFVFINFIVPWKDLLQKHAMAEWNCSVKLRLKKKKKKKLDVRCYIKFIQV